MKPNFLAFLLIFSYLSCQSQEAKMNNIEIKAFVTKISQQNKKIKTLQSDFTQTKKMDFLDKAIVTTGKMALKSPNLLSWMYTKPYQYTVIFKDNKIFVNDQGKKSSVDVKSKMFEKINNLIAGSTNGKLFNDPDFSVAYFKNGNTVISKFFPKNAQLKKYIRQVDLYFPNAATTVSQVNMLEASGDTTSIIFKNTKINGEISASVFEL